MAKKPNKKSAPSPKSAKKKATSTLKKLIKKVVPAKLPEKKPTKKSAPIEETPAPVKIPLKSHKILTAEGWKRLMMQQQK